MKVGNTILKITHRLTIFFMMGEEVKVCDESYEEIGL